MTEAVAASYVDKFDRASLSAPRRKWLKTLSLALASQVSYLPEKEITQITKETWGMRTCKFVNVDDTQCFISATLDTVLVAFRGSELNLGDWMGNLNMLSTTRPYGKVHRGFLSAFQVAQEEIEAELARFPNFPLVITGHSLGGALAVVAAAEWKLQKRRVLWVETFGQPGVGLGKLIFGQGAFCDFMDEHYEEIYYRVVNDMDVVTMIPPAYKHCGRLVRFDYDGEVSNALGSSELESLGADLGEVEQNTPMLDQEQFDKLRAELLQQSARQGDVPLQKAAVENAVESAVDGVVVGPAGVTGEEGFLPFVPSVTDHFMANYIAKIAHKAGY